MRIFKLFVAAICIIAFTNSPSRAASKTLPIPPVQQKLAEWCWLAVGEMIFDYYDVPNVNPAGIYQCGIAAAVFGGACNVQCALCNVGSGTIANMAIMLTGYPIFVRNVAGRSSPSISVDSPTSTLSEDDLKDEIDEERPVVAGISPHFGRMPPGLSEHAVLIVGYREIGDTLYLIINDPFPYAQAGIQDPYTPNGGTMVQPGRYRIDYDTMVDKLAWGNSISGIDSD